MSSISLEKKVDNLSIQLGATQLLLRSLVSCLLVEDDEESNRAIDKLLNSISRRSALGKANAVARIDSCDTETLSLVDELERAIRTEAIKLVADLRRDEKGLAS